MPSLIVLNPTVEMATVVVVGMVAYIGRQVAESEKIGPWFGGQGSGRVGWFRCVRQGGNCSCAGGGPLEEGVAS